MSENFPYNLESTAEVVDATMAFYDQIATGVRKVGMIDRDALQEALADPRTVTATVEDGREVAVMVPIDYAAGAGYDVERCTSEILPPGHKNETYLYLPTGGFLTHVDDREYIQLVNRLAGMGDGYIFSAYGERDDPNTSSQAELAALLHDAGKVKTDIPLSDSQSRPGHELASLSLYGMDMPRRDDSQDWEPVAWEDLYSAYERGVAEGKYEHDMENGTVVLRGSDLTDEQVSDMWEVYQDRFEWLGENHPISMEDNKVDFMKVLRSDSTLCSVKFKDGRPVCFADVVGDMDELYWLNGDFLNDAERMDVAPNQRVVFFPGIVSNGEGSRSSFEVIGLLANVFTDAKAPAKIVFENTNRSENYVPRIVSISVNQTGRAKVEVPQVIDRTYYVCTQFLQVTDASWE